MAPALRLLVIDAALKRTHVGVIDGERVAASRVAAPETGQGDLLAVWVEECLTGSGLAASNLDCIAVTIGPGSFTGLRAALALAAGIGLAARIPVHGVTIGEAFVPMLPGLNRPLWVTTTARRGRMFVECNGVIAAFDDLDLPTPDQPVALAGDRAGEAAARLAARGHDVLLTDARFPTVAAIGAALRLRLAGGLAPHPVQPVYVDPPEARLPAGGLRPPPVT